MLPEIFASPFQAPLPNYLWTQTFSIGYVLFRIAIMFFLLVEIVKRLPFTTEHNFKLAHTERPFFNGELKVELLWPMLTWFILMPAYYLMTVSGVEELLPAYIPKHSLQYLIADFPFWIKVVIGTILLDLALYIRHRFVHHFAWPYHAIHHSAKEITWITWTRLHPGDTFIMGIINTMFLWAMGFDAPAMVTAQIVMNYANSFNHSNIQLDFGYPLRYIVVSPNMHRWHHGTTDEAKNKNFCILWAWIDVLFRTFYVPPFSLPEKYGVFDEEGNELMGPTWVDQFIYPFKKHGQDVIALLEIFWSYTRSND